MKHNYTVSGVQLIADERVRQVEDEKWTFEHDDKHHRGELARVAALYAMPESYRREQILGSGISGQIDLVKRCWPTSWHFHWWKPTPEDRIRELVKAGALIAAEIERLARIEGPKPPEAKTIQGEVSR